MAGDGETLSSADVPFHVPATGRSGWVSATYGPHRDTNGVISGVIGIIREITERDVRTLPGSENGTPARTSEYFGINTFGVRQMRDKLHLLLSLMLKLPAEATSATTTA